MDYQDSLEFAQHKDQIDSLKDFRDQFHIPELNGKASIYFTGNSLGLQPKTTAKYVNEELEGWATLGVEGHFHSNKRPWFEYHKFSKETLSKIMGANPSEVVSMNSLTTNLHLLLISFYRPTKERYKIIMEAGAFPSDQYAVESQIKLHGFDYEDALIEVHPKEGKNTLDIDDINSAIDEAGDSLALVLFGAVQYYTGQFFPIKEITEATHKVGAIAGFDLAHAAGNVPLSLHDDEVDFAAWCTYKYLNSGPGGISGIFVHDKHGLNPDTPRLAGWWGHDESSRFKMEKGFKPMPGADGWQTSNVNIMSSAINLAALEIFDKAGMEALRKKSIELTGFLEFLLKKLEGIRIITPENPAERGCQLSLEAKKNGKAAFNQLTEAGVVADWREPNAIRVAPVPLYNTFSEVYRFYDILKQAVPNE
ncbi:kynureninase [Fulvivirga sediminis]|uniref:Kynureninase n=1 Tax=Fulvivirga sediminis TaxID=2803949 RepID=A0A937FAL4_9BACT|nr:kynureninase [Fulvivirga sediminis]MBL3656973.1 kynureninase [Fulvivirga sediminis]